MLAHTNAPMRGTDLKVGRWIFSLEEVRHLSFQSFVELCLILMFETHANYTM
jgi:hypothetical protein